jgi:hypothetical protein
VPVVDVKQAALTEQKIPRAMMSRWIFENQISTWLNQEDSRCKMDPYIGINLDKRPNPEGSMDRGIIYNKMSLLVPRARMLHEEYERNRARLGLVWAQLRFEAIDESTPPETVFLAAERALPKLEALLEAAREQIPNGSALPLVFTLVMSFFLG